MREYEEDKFKFPKIKVPFTRRKCLGALALPKGSIRPVIVMYNIMYP